VNLPGLILAIKIAFFFLASWVLVHVLAVLGVFTAVAYPFWWFLVPEKVPIIGPFTEKIREKRSAPFKLILLNTFLIFVVSAVSIGLVFLEGKFLFKLGFPPTQKTVSFVVPSKGQYRLGEIFPMKVEIAGIKTPVNAVQADLGFDPAKIEVAEISTEDSFANIFIQKEINNEAGYARLTGGLPNPGFFADRGVFGTVFFKGKTPGVTKIDFLPSSMVLANDGRGSNVLRELASASYLILPEEISEEEAELQSSVFLRPQVLGEKAGETQMKFFEEKDILGAETEIEKEIEIDKFNPGKIFLNILEGVDRFILNLWGKVLKPS